MSGYKGKKPSNSAVALRYNPDKDYTPIVVASGHGHVAEKIINLADENGVPIYRDESATALLTMLNVGPDLYQLVAGIYVQVMRIAKDNKQL